MVKVLFLVMEFPPVNTTGNFRSLKFVKYLKDFGVQPIVVTLKEDEASHYFKVPVDNSLLKEIPPDTPIFRVHCEGEEKYYGNKLKNFITIFFSIKDTLAVRWKKHLFIELEAIIKRHSPQLIFTSLPPFSSGKLAVHVAKKFRLPLIVDMRDLYANWGNVPHGSFVHYLLKLFEERMIFRRAAKIIGVTPQLIKTLKATHPLVKAEKFVVIPNGYDSDTHFPSQILFKNTSENISIGYVGSFYYSPKSREEILLPWWKRKGLKMLRYVAVKEDWLYRTPYFFFKCLSQVFLKYPQLKKRVCVEFIGKQPDWLLPMIEEFNLADNVKLHGVLPYEKAIFIQSKIDLMLTTSEKVLDGFQEHYSLPSKIFDYVKLGKPIIAFITPGIQMEFIKKSGVGIVCNPDDIEEATTVLSDLLQHGKTFSPDMTYLKKYHRKNTTSQLAEVIKLTTPD